MPRLGLVLKPKLGNKANARVISELQAEGLAHLAVHRPERESRKSLRYLVVVPSTEQCFREENALPLGT